MKHLEAKLIALIKAAVELAIIRHQLIDEDGVLDSPVVADIAADAANAVRGIDTCAGKPIPEWTAIFAKLPPGRPRTLSELQAQEIRARRRQGEKCIALASEFGVSEGHIRYLTKESMLTLNEALAKSDLPMPMAEGKSAKGKEIIAMNKGGLRLGASFRIVRGTTDPTTVRRLADRELAATDWEPVMDPDPE